MVEKPAPPMFRSSFTLFVYCGMDQPTSIVVSVRAPTVAATISGGRFGLGWVSGGPGQSGLHCGRAVAREVVPTTTSRAANAAQASPAIQRRGFLPGRAGGAVG